MVLKMTSTSCCETLKSINNQVCALVCFHWHKTHFHLIEISLKEKDQLNLATIFYSLHSIRIINCGCEFSGVLVLMFFVFAWI